MVCSSVTEKLLLRVYLPLLDKMEPAFIAQKDKARHQAFLLCVTTGRLGAFSELIHLEIISMVRILKHSPSMGAFMDSLVIYRQGTVIKWISALNIRILIHFSVPLMTLAQIVSANVMEWCTMAQLMVTILLEEHSPSPK